MTTDTQLTNACPHCGESDCIPYYRPHGQQCRSDLCEMTERAKKAETEVERLNGQLKKRVIEIAEQSVMFHPSISRFERRKELDQIKATLNPTDTPRTDAEVTELNRLMVVWKQRATMSETDLEASKAEVARLEAIIEKGDFIPDGFFHNRSFEAGVEQAKWSAKDEYFTIYKKERGLLDELYGHQKEELAASKAEVKRLKEEVIAAKESEAVWKTERDKADQRRLEAEAEVERLRALLKSNNFID